MPTVACQKSLETWEKWCPLKFVYKWKHVYFIRGFSWFSGVSQRCIIARVFLLVRCAKFMYVYPLKSHLWVRHYHEL